MEDTEKSLVKVVAVILTACALELGFMLYREACIKTDQLNPVKQYKVWKRWNREYERIFGPRGFADTNKDRILTFEEKAQAYRLMGFNEYYGTEQDFPGVYPISRLERAIEAYNAK